MYHAHEVELLRKLPPETVNSSSTHPRLFLVAKELWSFERLRWHAFGHRISVARKFSPFLAQQAKTGRWSEQELGRIRVLLADDHEAMLDRVARLLAIECNVVGTATDGQQALEAARELKPDVLVLDISMPVMNGIETAHRLKEAGAETRIVFLTVHDDPDFAREALEAGALGYVIKQRIASDLMIAINEVCAGRSFVSPLSPPPAIS